MKIYFIWTHKRGYDYAVTGALLIKPHQKLRCYA